ncbi:Uncharacterised protein [Mycobacteroides abscessus subsp. abscessus]|nr:Uncharacterised protein [Mycobacteroides abscessus subsp. abscessus]
MALPLSEGIVLINGFIFFIHNMILNRRSESREHPDIFFAKLFFKLFNPSFHAGFFLFRE